jgi:nitrate/TMAO reductase-like tetraheme cytochrome c subunit
MGRSASRLHPCRACGSSPGWALALVACMLWLCCTSSARAQAFESLLEPGKLSRAHEEFEGECTTCHVKFDRTAQDRLCIDCHKDVAHDLHSKAGFHGRMKPQTCKTCHTEHKGRDAQIAAFDRQRFDHASTDFMLRGAHQRVECARCHAASGPKASYRIPAHDCFACHRKDDTHRGSLGQKCADCHTESDWKSAKFDHDATRFPLAGKHASVACAQCHRNAQYKDTPLACVACHKKDDHHKAQFGDKCESCHAAGDWKTIHFNHDTDTRYVLAGKHRVARCESCHTGNLYRDKLPTACVECHRKDDKHKGSLGDNCATCHTERDWNEPTRFDHAKTIFPLLGKHASVKCKECHADTMFKQAPMECVACHRKDDKHKGALGDACRSCHDARDWKKTSFDHARTEFPLVGKHSGTSCADCHKTIDYRSTAKDCYACHGQDDKHHDQEGHSCGSCHDASGWRPAPRFDHGLTPFPLLGKHERLECKACHADARFKNAGLECFSCHAKDDAHRKTLGTLCEQCHNARTWKASNFDHDHRTKFVLDGKHVGLACARCHVRPMEGRVVTPNQCISCHVKDDVHDGSYGKSCRQCHVTSDFRTIRSRGTRASAGANAASTALPETPASDRTISPP